MLQRLGIRGKILAVVAVPILVLVVAAGAFTFTAARNLDSANNVEQLLDVVDDGAALVDNLQAERALTSNYVHSYQTAVLLHERAAKQVDTSLREALTAAENAEGPTGDALRAAAAEILAITGLETVRGTDGAVTIAPQPDNPPAGTLYELRSRVVVEVTDSAWATWPSEAEVSTYTTQYARLRTDIAAVHGDLPPNSEFVREVGAALLAMGDEATAFVEAVSVPPTYEVSLDNTYAAVDGDVARFLGTASKISTRDTNAGAIELVDALRARLGELETIRAQVFRLGANPPALQDFYARSISDLNALSEEVVLGVDDLALVQDLNAFGSLDYLIEQLQSERLVSERVIRQEFFYPGELNNMRRQVVTTDLALASARNTVDPLLGDEPLPSFGAQGSDGLQSSFVLIRDRLQLGTDVAIAGQGPRRWPEQVDREIAQYAPTRADIWRSALDRSAALQGQRLSTTVFTALVAAAVVAASLFVALLIARRIVGPLRRLTTTATAVRQELPRLVERVALPGQSVDVSEVQIPVESSDEIGRLAEAFNAVNAATLSIAGEQAALRGSIAEMFVNVARRDQVLLNRQLASIDEMERTQDDADTLQKLFALDHLATRMRRNSESLLVLAGIDTGRRMRRAMPLSDVIRTASSEIELYERVQLELDSDPAMVGHSALTTAHLFAELLENATVFSDPGSPVTVRTLRREGNYVVEIVDAGIGMGGDELQEANQRVVSTAASEILGAQRLGLFVVGRIARRIGARVEIESVEGEGTTARVVMPPSLFEADPDAPVEHVSENAVDEESGAPAALVGHDFADEEIDGLTTPELAPDTIPDERAPLPSDPEPIINMGFAERRAALDILAPGAGSYDEDAPDEADSTPYEVAPSAQDGQLAEPLPDPVADAAVPEPSRFADAAQSESSAQPDMQPPSTADLDSFPAPASHWDERPAAPTLDDSPIPLPDVDVTEARVTTEDITQLIEQDAEAAPEASEVDLDALTAGVSSTGLPTRRRAGAGGPEAPTETTSVLGLPPRASSGQIDELSASARTGFIPRVSANEVAPQTAEQRASMFRGFQNTRREDEAGVEGEAPSSLGYSLRREAVAPDTIPSLEDDEAEDR